MIKRLRETKLTKQKEHLKYTTALQFVSDSCPIKSFIFMQATSDAFLES